MARQEQSSRIERLKNEAISAAGSLQPWDGYFELRAKEMETLLSSYDLEDQGMCLEIGCANGFNSCLLSDKSKHIVATDLFRKDIKTHSQGMATASGLFKLMGADNCMALSCSGEDLPFLDGSFDTVLSFNTLEHIPEKAKAVKEMNRVLKRGGLVIVVVPNFFERIFYPFVFYKYMIMRAMQHLLTRVSKAKKDATPIKYNMIPEGEGISQKRISSFKDFRKAYPNFPVPEPHGAYKTIFHEFIGYLPWNWINLFKAGGFRVNRVFSTVVIPWQVLSFFSSSLPFKLYSKTVIWNSRVGSRFPMKYLGNNICLIARKP